MRSISSEEFPGASCGRKLLDRVVFGLNTPKGSLSDKEWDSFVESTIAPRFPSGFTVVQSQGHWRLESGKVDRESSRIVEIVHDSNVKASQLLSEVIHDYKRTYQQEAVLLMREELTACF